MEMINVKVDEVNGVLVTTSNRVAEELRINHYDLLEKIDLYISKFNSPELSGQFYIPYFYKAKNGRKVRNYLITKKGIAQLIGGYSSAVERAFELNVAYINKFDEMEKIINSGKQPISKVPVSYGHMIVRTFGSTPVMEIKLLSQITGLSSYQITMRARVIGVPTLTREALKEYKSENKEVENNIPRLTILFKEHVINICKYYKIYEKVKDIIENYFKIDNKIPYKEERDALGRTYEDRIKSTKRMIKMIDERINDKLKEIEHISKEINNYREHISFYMSQI